MRRIVIVGNSGSGKSTLADELANRLCLGRIELDAIYHGPGWTPTPTTLFVEKVTAALDGAELASGGWVVCGNYSDVRGLLWSRADTIVWLDYARPVVMRRVIWRSVRRATLHTALWNGNHEQWANLLALHDPDRSVIRWSWDGVRGYRNILGPIWGHARWAGVGPGPRRWIRLRSPRQCRRWASVAVAVRDRAGPSGLERN